MNKRGLYTLKVCMNGNKFTKENGQKCFFDKDYNLYGEAFVFVKKTVLGSYKLLGVVRVKE